MDLNKRRTYRKKKGGGMTLQELRENHSGFYNFLINYTEPYDKSYIYDIYKDFEKPYDDKTLSFMMKEIDNVEDMYEYHDVYMYLVSFKTIFKNFYNFLKIFLSLDDSTIYRLLFKCKYTTIILDGESDYSLGAAVKNIVHYNMHYEIHEVFLNSYCPTIDLKSHKNIYGKSPEVIHFIENYKDFYKYLREVKRFGNADIIKFLTESAYTENMTDNYELGRIITQSEHYKSFRDDYDSYLQSYHMYLDTIKPSDEFLKEYIMLLEQINQGFKPRSNKGGFKKKTAKTKKTKKLSNKK